MSSAPDVTMIGPKLAKLGYASYADYLQAEHWQEVRRRYRASKRPQSCGCGRKILLHLHHLTYERLGAEEMEDLLLLCADCHAQEHGAVLKAGVTVLPPGQRPAYRPWMRPKRKIRRFGGRPVDGVPKPKKAKRKRTPAPQQPGPRKAHGVGLKNDRLHEVQVANKAKQQAARDARALQAREAAIREEMRQK